MNPVVDRRELASCDAIDNQFHHCHNYYYSGHDEQYRINHREFHDDEPFLAVTPSDVRMFPATKASSKASSSSSSSSPSIPISKMKRSPSELQLQEDEVLAEYRDYCMYVRIVNGMNHSRRRSSLPGRLTTTMTSHQADNEESLANVVRTRNLELPNDLSSQQQQQRHVDYQKQHLQHQQHYHSETLHQSWPMSHKATSDCGYYYNGGPNVDLAPRLLHPDSFGDGLLSPYVDRQAATEDEGVFVMDL